MFRPAVWISQLAWPTNDSRTLSPSTRGGGVSACALGAHSGQACALPVPAELPAQHLAQRFRRHAVGIEELLAVEMIGDRPVIGFHAVHPDEGTRSPRRRRPAMRTRGDALIARLASKRSCFGKGVDLPRRASRKAPVRPRLSLTFRPCGGLTRPLLGKMFFSTRRPVPEAGGQRPTARCALGRKVFGRSLGVMPGPIGRHHPRKRVIQYPGASLSRAAASGYPLRRV